MPKPATAPAADAATPTATKKPRVAAEVVGIRTDIAPPTNIRAGGGKNKSPYPFDTLEIGGSFGIKNKDKKALSSIVSNQNRRKENQRQKIGADGAPLFHMNDVKDAAGAVVGQTRGEPITERIKEFIVADVDPKNDPDGASVRVWRTK